jgi:type IV pilus assembly protein PilB
MKIPRSAGLPLISRIKIMSGLDIADRRRPQDGRARVGVNGLPVDLRVSTLPATLGEKVVIRVLDQSTTILALDSLGMNPGEPESIKELLDNRDGIILVTGPTGSGKTTTLYSALRHVQSEGVNIVTVEDPVEYRLQGVVQVQVHEKAGLTFAAALRSILRQDPDIVLVGEIRDKETGSIAIQASLTGHLVLSTLHTNDAPNAVTRLQDIGIEGHKTATALRGVVAQRLMRRLCSVCKEAWVEEVPEKLRRWVPQDTPLSRSVGCPECAMTGFKGRFSIVEVLKITPEIEKLISKNMPADAISDAARENGMKSLWDSGLQHLLRGESTIDELLRVVEVPGDEDLFTNEEIEDRASGEFDLKQPTAESPDIHRAIEELEHRLSGKADARISRNSVVEGFELLGSEDTTASEGGGPISVLLVDDEDQLRRVMKDLLERDGYNVVEAVDGVEALDMVDQHAPDVIVLDLNLPNLDGYGVLKKLKSRPETSSIPVIVLTANRDEDNEVRVFEHGATDFLSKPFRARALSARLKAVVARSGMG